MLMKVFLSRCHPAPDVPLGLVRVQHLAGLAGVKRSVTSLCTVLLLILNCFAVCLTVALFSIIYTAISTALSSI